MRKEVAMDDLQEVRRSRYVLRGKLSLKFCIPVFASLTRNAGFWSGLRLPSLFRHEGTVTGLQEAITALTILAIVMVRLGNMLNHLSAG